MRILYVVLIAMIAGLAVEHLFSLESWLFNILGIVVILVGISIANIITASDIPESGE